MTKPRRFDRNLVVIGAGSAGLVAAIVAAKLHASVTLIEAAEMGGDCLNTGCVPSKALIHAAHLAHAARTAAALGLTALPGPIDSRAAFRHVRASIAAIAPHDSAERFRGLGVDVRHGRARITSPWTVAVNGDVLTTRAIVVATGAAPVMPDIPGLADAGCLTSEALWTLTEAPRRLLILGGGPIGCELAQAFARLGSAVTLVQRGERLLPREEPEVGALILARLEGEGVQVKLRQRARDVRDGMMRFEDGSVVGFDTVLAATGRRARTAGFGLENLGIALDPRGTIAADARLRTAVNSIYVCGDVAGPWQFTHAAGYQGAYAALGALFGRIPFVRPDRAQMPSVTYTAPEVARVGLTEREAGHCAVTRYDLADLDRAIVDEAREGFVKVITEPGSDRILGVTIVAPRAGEMLGEFVLAMTQDLGLKKLFGPIRAYPGYLDANRAAAGAWRDARTPAWASTVLGRFHAWRRG